MNIMFTTYEDFIHDQEQFIRNLLDFYGADLQWFDRKAATSIKASVDYHKRLGSTDEWRSVLDPYIVGEINREIPDEWFDRFKWRR